ncbi:MAG: AraC family ligand binding domain-containing protein, partial [Planctomycetota bacterium]
MSANDGRLRFLPEQADPGCACCRLPGDAWLRLEHATVDDRHAGLPEHLHQEHRHPVFHAVVVGHGTGSFLVDGRRRSADAPRLFLIDPD